MDYGVVMFPPEYGIAPDEEIALSVPLHESSFFAGRLLRIKQLGDDGLKG